MRETKFRKTVTWTSFCFMILVIYAHAVNMELFLGSEWKSSPAGIAESLLGNQLSQVAVPGFFFLSGILFFRNYDLRETRRKWRSRAVSLLIPYLLWNFLYYLGYLIGTHLPGLSTVVGREAVPLSVIDFLQGVFLYKYNYVFWYLFQLILLTLISPLLYLLASNGISFCLTEVFLLVIIFLRKNWTPLNADACFYYFTAAGIALAIRPRNWRKKAERARERERELARERQRRIEEDYFYHSDESPISRPVSLKQEQYGGQRKRRRERLSVPFLQAFAVAGILAYLLYLLAQKTANDLPLVMSRLLGVGSFWFLISALPLPEPREFMHRTFLTYAIHFAPVRLINKTAALLFSGNAIVALILYLIMPALMMLLTTLVAELGRRLFPEFLWFLTGGREG